MKEEIIKETGWGVHMIEHTSRGWVASSRGHGGAEGYNQVFDSRDEAMAYIEKQTQPHPPARRIVF